MLALAFNKSFPLYKADLLPSLPLHRRERSQCRRHGPKTSTPSSPAWINSHHSGLCSAPKNLLAFNSQTRLPLPQWRLR